MRVPFFLLLVIILAACGGTPTAVTESSPVPEPTLSPDNRAALRVIDERIASMIEAAEELQALGQESRVNEDKLRASVRANTQAIAGGGSVINQVALPEHAASFTKQMGDAAVGCMETISILPDFTVVTIEAVRQIRPQLETCVRELKLVQGSLEAFSLST
jgi:hypothetical protein